MFHHCTLSLQSITFIQMILFTPSSLPPPPLSLSLSLPLPTITDHSRIYWSDLGTGYVGRSTLNGQFRRNNILPTLDYPTGLALDYTTGILYVADPKLRVIKCFDKDGNNEQLIHQFTGECMLVVSP